MKKLIIFVCNGNIERSVIAAESMKKILKERKLSRSFSADSYGIQGTKGTDLPKHRQLSQYPKEWKAVRPGLDKLGLDISRHTFQKISLSIMKKASLIIAMDKRVYSEAENSLIKQFPDQSDKIIHFSDFTLRHKVIRDPAGSGDQKLHAEVIKDIYSTLDRKFGDILARAR